MKPFQYQWRALFLMTMAWAFSGLAHNCVSFLFPYFSEEFGLGSQHNGYLTATLALFWTVSILICGKKADQLGQVKVMVPGLLIGASALALLSFSPNVLVMYLLTAVAGFGCGSMCSPSLSFLAEQSEPQKRGLFYGVAMSAFTLVGSAGGSLVFTRLAASAVGWRGCYLVMAALVAITATLIFLLGRNIPRNQAEVAEEDGNYSFRDLLPHKNVLLSTLLACLNMMWFFTVAAFTILYLIDAKEVSAVVAGSIFAGFGIGGFLGEFFAPIISDYVGRKKTVLVATTVGAIAYAAFMLIPMPEILMTVTIAIASLFISGTVAILSSVVPSESVPPQLVATATSFSPACGEFVGGVVAPVLAGFLIGILGIGTVMPILIALPCIVIVGVLFLKETAPMVLAKKNN